MSMDVDDEKKTMSCLWLQEKSCDMEGNAEAESAGERVINSAGIFLFLTLLLLLDN